MDYLSKTMLDEKYGYPKVGDWLMKSEFEIDLGYKKAWVFWKNERIVSNFLYQKHKEFSNFLEIKNIRTVEEYKRRLLSAFLWSQIEHEESKNYDAAIVDTRSSNLEMKSLLLHLGFKPIGENFLYDNKNPDTIFIKPFNKKTDVGIICKSREFFLGSES